MGLTFPFEKSISPIFGPIYRPVAKVYFFAQAKKRWYETWMIVDTGADYTLLPNYFSVRLGVDLDRDCQVFRTAGIGGEEKVYLLKKTKVKIGPWERIIPVGFLERDEIPPLLGRQLFLETFEVIITPHHTLTLSSE